MEQQQEESSHKLDLIALSKNKKLDVWLALNFLHKSKKGVQDFICNELYKFPDHIIEFFLPQLCNILLKDADLQSLCKFLMDKCSSMHLAIKMFSWFQAAVEDNVYPRQKTNTLWHECEMAAVNAQSRSSVRIATWTASASPSPPESPRGRRHMRSASMPEIPNAQMVTPAPSLPASSSTADLHKSLTKEKKRLSLRDVPVVEVEGESEDSVTTSSTSTENSPVRDSAMETVTAVDSTRSSSADNLVEIEKKKMGNMTQDEEDSMESKKTRHHYFHHLLQFISALMEVGFSVKRKGYKTKMENNRELYGLLKQLHNDYIQVHMEKDFEQLANQGKAKGGIYFPLFKAGPTHQRIIRILYGDSFCLSSRDKVPYMLFVETIDVNNDPSPLKQSDSSEESSEPHSPKPIDLNDSISVLVNDSPTIPHLDHGNIMKPADSIEEAIEKVMTLNREQLVHPRKYSSDSEDWVVVHEKEDEMSNTLRLAYPELWVEKEERLRKSSPYGTLPGWKLQSVVVKAGDDLRQEQLAVQLISTFHKIWRKSELPLWLFPYAVVATSSSTGLIETIPDAISLDTLKKRIPNAKTLEDYFTSAYGDKTNIKFLQAQRNFVESLAAYSLVCYLLQIKDRHNGNILLDKEGHVVHIDYGFMLTSSPGSLGFETAPFKLTDEFIKLMGGDMSDMFNYFKLLLIRGFLEVRKHYQKIVLLVEMLLPGYKMKCFARKEQVIRELKDRFQLHLNEKECVTFVGDMIRESARNWRTGSYDNYQYYLNGILA